MAVNKLNTFKNHLGYNGKKVNEEKAILILEKIGVDATNEIGETPLIIAAYLERVEVLKIIIDQTNNIDYKIEGQITESALLEACGQRRLESIKLLVEAGANLEQVNRFGLTPLSKIFTNAFSDPIPTAEYLVSKGAKITKRVVEMGSDWDKEKFRNFLADINFSLDNSLSPDEKPDLIEKAEKKPAEEIDIAQIHHVVNAENYFQTLKVIWQNFVPKSGQADTVQGELLRAIEKLRDEAHRNGNINFQEDCHGILINYLRTYLGKESNFSDALRKEINDDLDRLTIENMPYTKDDIYDRISSRIVDWYLFNPTLLAHAKNGKLYC
ncbi:MAG: hypothetical protein GQ574_26060 [Crocinitomix sp.]|nr:hypothetical protein [Crocinitomix sp.]